jgi:hypothetical protein
VACAVSGHHCLLLPHGGLTGSPANAGTCVRSTASRDDLLGSRQRDDLRGPVLCQTGLWTSGLELQEAELSCDVASGIHETSARESLGTAIINSPGLGSL